jgi:membrane associated rhomboid family serine protease
MLPIFSSLVNIKNVLSHQFSWQFFLNTGYTLGMAMLCLIVAPFPMLTELFELHIGKVNQGEVWRLLSYVWVHNGVDHLAWNVLTLVATGCIAEQLNRKVFLLFLGLAIPMGGVVRWFIESDTYIALGYSSIAAGLFVLLLMWIIKLGIKTQDTPMILVSASLLIFYIGHEMGFIGSATGWEVLTGRSVDEQPGMQVNSGHLMGMGLAFIFGILSSPKPEPNREP